MYRSLIQIAHLVLDTYLHLTAWKLPTRLILKDKIEIALGTWERETLAILPSLDLKSSCIVDVGSHVGLLSRSFAKISGSNGKVYAFEPSPDLIPMLKNNTRAFPQIEVIESAVSDQSGVITLHLNQDSDSLNSMVRTQQTTESIPCSSVSLDDFFEKQQQTEQDFNLPKLIKIDVEGAELLVLKGMKKLLQHQQSPLIIIEYCPENYETVDWSVDAAPSFLLQHNYHLQVITPSGLINATELPIPPRYFNRHGYVNLLATPNTR